MTEDWQPFSSRSPATSDAPDASPNSWYPTPIDDAERAPLSGSVYQIKDDLQRLVELGVDHVMWDPNGVVPYETQLRLLEPLIAVRPS